MRATAVSDIARTLGGELGAPGDGLVTSVTLDSREACPGCLFAAVKGERADGHDYIHSAFAAGAACALAERVPAGGTGPVIVVPDVAAALRALAAWYRGTLQIPFIGVTGSVGKTTTKEMIASVLGARLAVHKTPGNLNNELGVPLTIFGVEPWHEAAVVEMGISHFGEMTRLTEIVRPDIAVFTVIGDAHLENLGSREGVLKAKSEIFSGMSEKGLVLANGDDPLLLGLECVQHRVFFGLGEHCAVRAERILSLGESGMRCDIVRGARRLQVRIPGFGQHMVYAALAGAAAGFALGLRDGEIAAGIAAYETVGSRARVTDTGFLTLYDDCYNANPTSTASALRSLMDLPGRHVAILGDMLELGKNAPGLHAEIGALARNLGLDLLLCAGESSRRTAEAAGDIARYFETKAALTDALPSLLKPGDAVLVKASRGMRFEDVVERIEKL